MPLDLAALGNLYGGAGTLGAVAMVPTPATTSPSSSGITAPTNATSGSQSSGATSGIVGAATPGLFGGIPKTTSSPSLPTGMSTPISSTGTPDLPPNGSGGVVDPTAATGSTPPVDPNATQPFDMQAALKKVFDQITNMNNMNSAQMQKLQDTANAQAQAQADKQESLYNTQLQQLTDTHNEGLQNVQNSTLGAQSTLDNNYFQKWLQSRQEAANRGMAGSGIGQDQDTRLLLSKQQDLAGLLRDAASQNYHLDNTYDTAKSGVQSQEAQNNPSTISAQLFKNLYATAQDSANKSSQTAADLLGKAFGYYMPSQDALVKAGTDATNNQNDNAVKLQVEQWKNSSAEQIAGMDDATKYKIAQLPWTEGLTAEQKTQAILDLTKVMGKDENGNPTLDAQKAQQQANHWATSDATAKASVAAQLSMSKDRLAANLADTTQKADQAATQLLNTQYEGQGKMLSEAITAKNAEIAQLNNQIAGAGGKGKDPALDSQFQSAINLSNSLQASLVALSTTTSSTNNPLINTPGLNQ